MVAVVRVPRRCRRRQPTPHPPPVRRWATAPPRRRRIQHTTDVPAACSRGTASMRASQHGGEDGCRHVERSTEKRATRRPYGGRHECRRSGRAMYLEHCKRHIARVPTHSQSKLLRASHVASQATFSSLRGARVCRVGAQYVWPMGDLQLAVSKQPQIFLVSPVASWITHDAQHARVHPPEGRCSPYLRSSVK